MMASGGAGRAIERPAPHRTEGTCVLR